MVTPEQATETNQLILAQITEFSARYGQGADIRNVRTMTDFALETLKRQRQEQNLRLRHVGSVSWQFLLDGRDRGLFNMAAIQKQRERNTVAENLIDRGMVVTELVDANVTDRKDEFLGHIFGLYVDLESVTYANLMGIKTSN